MKYIFFLPFLILFSTFFTFSQNQLTVLDKSGMEPMPFVKVFPNDGDPFFTNVDGIAEFKDGITSMTLTFTGYKDTTIFVNNQSHLTVKMSSEAVSFDEVVILPGVNPALRIINNTTENRKYNHPLKNDAFTYESYSKFTFDVDTVLAKKVMNMPYDEKDTVSNLIRTQHLFLLESSTERKFIPPARDQETITAYKVSGLNNPIFSSFAQSTQTFHFYDNQFELLGNKYLNPIGFGATSKYYYLIEDTTINESDTTFVISFRPRPGVTIDCMKGFLFINTNGFALEKVIAEPAKESQNGTKIKIIQEYKFIDGKKWFPVNLKTIGELKSFQIKVKNESGYIVGRGTTYISSIKLNPDEMKKTGFNNLTLTTEKNAGKKSEEEWNTLRKDTLTDRDIKTYHVLDSIGKVNNFDRKINTLLALATGKIKIGPISLPIDRIINYNYHEGYRLGLGVETSDKLMKNINVGGYFAWGTKDKDWKYGGYSTFYINRRLGMSIGLKYQQDVYNRGTNRLASPSWDITSPSVYKDFYQRYMDRQRLAEINFTISPLGNLTFHLVGNYQRLEFTKNYRFTDENGIVNTKLDNAELALEMKWNIRQRTFLLGDFKMPQPSKYPKIQLKIAKGISGIVNSQIDYWRLFASIDEDLTSIRWGKLNLHLEASQTFGDVPLAFKQYTEGTRRNWGLATSNALETAYPGEFYHNRQISFITRYSFPVIKTKAKWFAPEFILHHGLGYGDMANKSQHYMKFWSMDKGLFEGGLIISGILNYSIIRLGVGVFYRYGYYSEPNAFKNLVPKISINIVTFR